MIGALLLGLLAQTPPPTGYASVFVDAVPHRDATELRARLFAEEKVDAGPRVRLAASGFVEGLLADRSGSVTDAIVEPQDVTLTIRAKRAELTAGLGRVVWGRLDELQPTDVVNPLDLARFFFEGRSDARLAVPLVRGRLFAGDKASVEVVYVPFFRRARFDRLDEPTSPFNLAPTAPIADRTPARTAANAQGGARVNVTTGRVDWSVSAYDGFRPFGLYSLTPEGLLQRTYARFTMVGADFETARGAWVARGEVAVFPRDAFQTPGSAAIFDGQTFDAGAGVDRKAGDYRLSGDVLVHREAHDATPALSERQRVEGSRTDVSIIASADRTFAREKYTGRLFAVYNPSQSSGFVRGIAVAGVRDNVKLEGSVGWFAGSGDDTISRFADSDFVYVRVKYFF
jgi:hypothetical protein